MGGEVLKDVQQVDGRHRQVKQKCSFSLKKLVAPFLSAQLHETKTTFHMLFLSMVWIRGRHLALVTESGSAPHLRSLFFCTTVGS